MMALGMGCRWEGLVQVVLVDLHGEILTSGIWMGANIFSPVFPVVNLVFMKKLTANLRLMPCVQNRQQMAVYPLGNGIQAKVKNIGENSGTYHALYPRSWYQYENVFQAQLSCEQLSPIWAENYQESSYPIAIFEWIAHNPTNQKPITLSILFTWQNIVGWFTNAIKNPTVKVRDDGSPVYEYQPRWQESAGNFNRFSGRFSSNWLFNDPV
jgi:hypothetical protein